MSSLDLFDAGQPMDPKLMLAIESAFRSVSLNPAVEFVKAPRSWHKSNPEGRAKGPAGQTKLNLKMQIIRRDGARCVYCGREFIDLYDATLDHVVPNAVVGHWQTWNLVLACEECNLLKADRVPAVLMPLLSSLLYALCQQVQAQGIERQPRAQAEGVAAWGEGTGQKARRRRRLREAAAREASQG